MDFFATSFVFFFTLSGLSRLALNRIKSRFEFLYFLHGKLKFQLVFLFRFAGFILKKIYVKEVRKYLLLNW